MPRRTRKPQKKPIDQYNRMEASRANNPPVGLVTPETDRDAGKKMYAHDPRIAPSPQFDPHRGQIGKLIDDGIVAETIEERGIFPMAGAKDGWTGLTKNPKAGIDSELVEAYRGMVSLPFEMGENKRIAVKIMKVE